MTAYSTAPARVRFPLPFPTLGRLAAALRARRLRQDTVATYRALLIADDRTLHDLGVTRDDVCQLLRAIEPQG